MSDFLKKAYDNGTVKDVSEAFKEYPVEEEWHKGDANNYIKEASVAYQNEYDVGDIVFVKKYEYENGKAGYDYLFVLIDKDYKAVPIENFGMLISSNLNKLKFSANVLLQKDDVNNLNKDSIVKTDIIYKIANEQIKFKIGRVENEIIEEYKNKHLENLK